MNTFKKGYVKVETMGNIIRVKRYEKIPKINKTGGRKKNENRGNHKKEVDNRRKQAIIDLINTNFSNNNYFITLTYKDNITDIERTNKDFKKFIQRLKRNYFQEKYKDSKGKTRYKDKTGVKLKYLAVPEQQKRGAIHYHIIINLNEIETFKIKEWYIKDNIKTAEHKEKEKELFNIWGQGFTDIRQITTVDNIGAYLTSYLKKTLDNDFLKGKKAYLRSRGLEKPEVIEDPERVKNLLEALQNYIPAYSTNYHNDYLGHIQMKEFNITKEGYFIGPYNNID